MKSGLGARLVAYRKRSGLGSQRVAAKELGTTVNTIWSYENEKTLPSLDFLANFAAKTGSNLYELVALRLKAGGHEIEMELGRVMDDTQDGYQVRLADCAAHARRALLEAKEIDSAWSLAIMEMAVRGEISPQGIDRLIQFIMEKKI